MTIEDQLRGTVAPRAGSDPAVDERVRREAMAALAGMRRRHRVRRVVSVGAAAGIAAIAGFFVFAMPRGDRAPGPAAETTLPVALLDRPERAVDRLNGDPWAFGVRGNPERVRVGLRAGGVEYLAATVGEPAMLCVVARPSPEMGSSACSDPQVLRRVGVLAYLPPNGGGGDVAASSVRAALLVPDGIERIRLAGRETRVRDNMAALEIRGAYPKSVTLFGPAAADVRPDGGADWERGADRGLPSVTVPLSPGSNDTYTPVPIADQRLLAPSTAPAGSVITLRIVGPSGLAEGAGFGVDALLERREDGRWVPAYHLVIPLPDAPRVPAPVPVNTPNFGWVSIGLGGGAPYPVRLPSVAPGRYRISKDISRLGVAGYESRTLTAEITITPDPVAVPESPGVPIDRSAAEVVAMDSDGTRIWRVPALPEASPPGTTGRLTCWLFLGGTDCADAEDLARIGGFAMTVPDTDGTWRTAVVAAPGATAIRIAGRQRLMVNGVAFASGLSSARPDVEVVFRGGATKRFR